MADDDPYEPDDPVDPNDPNDPANMPWDYGDDGKPISGLPGGPTDGSDLPISEDPGPPQSSEPMEDLEEEEEEEDAEEEEVSEEKAPTPQRIRIPKPKSSRSLGPLAVDSIGDYLEDIDFTAIDEEARRKAQEGMARLQQQSAVQSDEDAEEPELVEEEEEPAPSVDKLEPSSDTEPPEGTEQSEAFTLPNYSVKSESGFYGVGTDGSTPSSPLFPALQGPGNASHMAAQRNMDYGVQGGSSFELEGQNENAVKDSVEASSDAIKTVSAAIVDTLQDMSRVLNQHHDAIQMLRDIIASSGEEDVR